MLICSSFYVNCWFCIIIAARIWVFFLLLVFSAFHLFRFSACTFTYTSLLHNMRNFISSNRLIEIDLKAYINVRMKTYWKYSVYDHDLYNVMRDDFENFNIEIWRFVSINFWSTIHKICYTQNVWINLSCAANEKRADCIMIAFVFKFYEIWIEKQILHVKKNTKNSHRSFRNNEKK